MSDCPTCDHTYHQHHDLRGCAAANPDPTVDDTCDCPESKASLDALDAEEASEE